MSQKFKKKNNYNKKKKKFFSYTRTNPLHICIEYSIYYNTAIYTFDNR